MAKTKRSFEEICYKKNFLREVIAKMDFLNPIEEMQKQICHSALKTGHESAHQNRPT